MGNKLGTHVVEDTAEGGIDGGAADVEVKGARIHLHDRGVGGAGDGLVMWMIWTA